MSNLTREERFEIIEKSMAASKAGNDDEAMRIAKQLPIAPWLAKAGKEVWGKDFLLENGYNLSEAEAEYGKDWLSQ
ncbi:hypothetical protein [Desulfovibrio litoralis]|uniref:Uncharacterized protein n=1 Tax=Desulfovibrio litoralis DSM 11393 TaxID=1121455 RepID=A0A1M7TQ55_9BACT|nr:hypothetical protein [Desulfovibrio litoralis]SHN72788.1 hypothetical protein SAMN02745728_02352 [Desulfovibrio litoralis DSM 11393]